MRNGVFLKLVFVLSFFLITGCVTQNQTEVLSPVERGQVQEPLFSGDNHKFNPEEWAAVTVPSGMVKKVNNFMVVYDNSASMTEKHDGSVACLNCHENYRELEHVRTHIAYYDDNRDFETIKIADWEGNPNNECLVCHADYAYTKSLYAKRVVTAFNNSIPDLELISALRIFGAPVFTRLIADRAAYVKGDLDHSIREILNPGGASPMDHTFNAIKKDWFASDGKIAIILISDGKGMGDEDVLASEKLRMKYGEKICIYTIQIGNDLKGKSVLERIASGNCGLAVRGANLLNKPEMEKFITEVFLTEGGSADRGELDSDGDGVPDLKDDCPDTKPGLAVDENGCWKLMVLSDVLFDFDKYNIKPAGALVLDQVVDLLNKHKFLKLKMSGHTDNKGSMEYNIQLSKRRVTSGLNYLVAKGIDADRISISWHSFSIPKVSNATSEGRSLNRRIEFKFNK